MTLPYKNQCKNYTNNDVDSQATPKWYIKHDIITVLLLEALERQRNASALPPLLHEKGSFCGTHFSMKNSQCPLGLLGLVGACQEFVGTCQEFVGSCRELSGMWIFMESHFEEIAIVVNKILAKFPIPEILQSVPDFRELNKYIICKPFPILKIQDLLLKLEGFQHTTSLDLNMGYYHIELMPFSKRPCTIVMPWGKYEYQCLPMGLCNSPDIFQERMFELFLDLEFIRAYIDDLLVMSCSTFENHLECLEKVLLQLSDMGPLSKCQKIAFS